jgi:WD40 repeat protein
VISATVGKYIAAVTDDGTVYLFDSQLNTADGFPVTVSHTRITSPALADISGDGSRDIIIFSGNEIFALNRAGAMLDNFPIRITTENPLLSSPVVADVNGDGKEEIVAVTQEGLVFAYGSDGKTITGFPVLSGINNGSTPAVFYMNSLCLSCVDIGLAIASDDGYVYAWKTGTLTIGPSAPPAMSWPQYLQNARKTGMIGTTITGTPRSEEFFPSSLAYNWPNPVSGDQNYITYIRYYIRETAKVHIKIFDGSGDMITEFDAPGMGGIENEISWNVSKISSGIYFAHIEASGLNGNGGSAIIKIAVVK